MKIKVQFAIEESLNCQLDHVLAEQKQNGYNRSLLVERALRLLFFEVAEKKITVMPDKKEVN